MEPFPTHLLRGEPEIPTNKTNENLFHQKHKQTKTINGGPIATLPAALNNDLKRQKIPNYVTNSLEHLSDLAHNKELVRFYHEHEKRTAAPKQ